MSTLLGQLKGTNLSHGHPFLQERNSLEHMSDFWPYTPPVITGRTHAVVRILKGWMLSVKWPQALKVHFSDHTD